MVFSNLRWKLTFSYLFDWIIVILLAAGGGVLNYINGYHRPFSLTDINIGYPDKPNIISLPVLVVVAFLLPAGIIFVLCLVFRYVGRGLNTTSRQIWLQTVWEMHVGLIGLCVALAATLFVTSGLKDMVGKPRPNLLARCDADSSRLLDFLVGGYGKTLDSEAEALIARRCLRCLPSGHSSFSCAGLVYLSLWLCARFSLKIPHLGYTTDGPSSVILGKQPNTGEQSAPPLWQLALALSPTVVAIFICSSRYADFHHAGIDIFCGAVLGTIFAFSSFRLYHLPMRRSRGALAWGERSNDYAFFSVPAQAPLGPGDRQDVDSRMFVPRDAGESHELRDIEGGRHPTRVDTQSTTSSMLRQPRSYR